MEKDHCQVISIVLSVSQASSTYKVLESLIRDHIIAHMNQEELFSDKQLCDLTYKQRLQKIELLTLVYRRAQGYT